MPYKIGGLSEPSKEMSEPARGKAFQVGGAAGAKVLGCFVNSKKRGVGVEEEGQRRARLTKCLWAG